MLQRVSPLRAPKPARHWVRRKPLSSMNTRWAPGPRGPLSPRGAGSSRSTARPRASDNSNPPATVRGPAASPASRSERPTSAGASRVGLGAVPASSCPCTPVTSEAPNSLRRRIGAPPRLVRARPSPEQSPAVAAAPVARVCGWSHASYDVTRLPRTLHYFRMTQITHRLAALERLY